MKIEHIWELPSPQELTRPDGYHKIIIRNNSTTNSVFILENENDELVLGFPIPPATQLEFNVTKTSDDGTVISHDRVILSSGQRFVSVAVMWVN